MKKERRTPGNCTLLALVLAGMVAAWPAGGLGRDAAEQQDPWSPYNIIIERNIFSRQRSARSQREDRSERQERERPPAPNPESYYVLKGVVQEDGEFIAFLEDSRGGEIIRVRKGDKVARGVVNALSLDSIEFQLAEQTTNVGMGYDLEGGRGTITMATLANEFGASASSTSGADPNAATQPEPAGDEADILRQLMQRRQQQLGQ